MISFLAFYWAGCNRFRFDPLIKDDTYAFLHFKPYKRQPKNFVVMVSVYEKDNTLIEEHCFNLELDATKKSCQDHYIGIQQEGTMQRVVFTTWSTENVPLNINCLEVAVVKIKDGDEDRDGGIRFKPKCPRLPDLVGC